jgi:ABC-type antimicrobial peptide transport system permease subunit
VLINAACARTFWPGEDAVGKTLVSGNGEVRVVGVVDDIRAESVEGQQGWQIYYPATQQTPAGAELVVRTQMPPAALASSVMSALRELNPKQPAAEFRPIRSLVDHAVSPRRFFLMLVGSFAGLGLLLAALGIFGVISYSVTQRTQEIGIRMALGATMAQVQRSVLLRTLRLALIGIATGTVVSLAVAKAIAALLFGTSAGDPITFAGMVLLLGTVALLAGYLPARRASRINPMVALRNN